MSSKIWVVQFEATINIKGKVYDFLCYGSPPVPQAIINFLLCLNIIFVVYIDRVRLKTPIKTSSK